jgi:anti-sigma factor RsiW
MPNGKVDGFETLAVNSTAAVNNTASRDMHSDAWWIRVMDGDLTVAERLQWEAHLQTCERCRNEWAALSRVDAFLLDAPAPPALSPDFTAATVQMIVYKQRWRRYLSFLAGLLIVVVVTALFFGLMGPTLTSLGQGMRAIVSARQALFHSLVQTMLALIVRWRTALPFILGASVLAYALMMPNGLLMTVAIVWLSGHRRTQVPSGA